MSADFKERLLCTRTCGGKGSPHTVDVKNVNGKIKVVFGGSGMVEGMYTKNAIQSKPADNPQDKTDPKDGFFVVLEEQSMKP